MLSTNDYEKCLWNADPTPNSIGKDKYFLFVYATLCSTFELYDIFEVQFEIIHQFNAKIKTTVVFLIHFHLLINISCALLFMVLNSLNPRSTNKASGILRKEIWKNMFFLFCSTPVKCKRAFYSKNVLFFKNWDFWMQLKMFKIPGKEYKIFDPGYLRNSVQYCILLKTFSKQIRTARHI